VSVNINKNHRFCLYNIDRSPISCHVHTPLTPPVPVQGMRLKDRRERVFKKNVASLSEFCLNIERKFEKFLLKISVDKNVHYPYELK
jgi:hypothetical protein